MIYDYSLCIHNRHFINWIVLGVTRYINVIAINSEVGYIFLYHITRWLTTADYSNPHFPLNIVNGNLGKPSRDVHRGTQTAREQGTLAPLQRGLWLPSRGDGRKKEEWEGKMKLAKKMNLNCYYSLPNKVRSQEREKGKKSRANRSKALVKPVQHNLVKGHFTCKFLLFK